MPPGRGEAAPVPEDALERYPAGEYLYIRDGRDLRPDADPTTRPYTYYHDSDYCNAPCFLTDRYSLAFEGIRNYFARNLSGNAVQPSTVLRCESCGEALKPLHLRNLKPTPGAP